MIRWTREFCALAGFVLSALAASPGAGATLGFGCITNNLPGDCAIGAAQLRVDVGDAGGGLVLFSFRNAGPAASSLTDVYFADGSLLALASVINGPGVSFSQDATPPDLPGGSNASPPFHVTAGFLADSNPPVQPNGVNPGEVLGIRFSLKPGMSYLTVLDELADGRLRIGVHVQGFASGGSESFVNHPLPEPGALGLGAVIAALLVERRRQRAGQRPIAR